MINNKQIRRNCLKMSGFAGVPNWILDRITKVEITSEGIARAKFTVQVSTKAWRGCYGSANA